MAEVLQTLRGILVTVTVVAVVESLSLLALTMHRRAVRADVLEQKQRQWCTVLDKLITEKDGENKKHCPEGLNEEVKNQTNLSRCCGPLADFMDVLVAKGVPKRYDSKINPELASLDLTKFKCKECKNQRPIARLVNVTTKRNAVQVGNRSTLFWNSQSLSDTKSGLIYKDDGTISVEETDLYFVSLQLKTKLIKGDGVDDTIRHSVQLISNGTDAMILEDVRTMCETSTEDAVTTSVVGAMFKLKKGDRLYVATSHPQNIAPDPQNNYFSIYIL